MSRASELAAVTRDLAVWKPRPPRQRTGTTPKLQAERQRINQLTKETK